MEKNSLYDKDFRDRVRHLDKDLLAELITNSTEGIDVKVITATKNVFYFVIPVADTWDLSNIQAGVDRGCASTAGSAGSAYCISSVTLSVGTASTASSVGSLACLA